MWGWLVEGRGGTRGAFLGKGGALPICHPLDRTSKGSPSSLLFPFLPPLMLVFMLRAGGFLGGQSYKLVPRVSASLLDVGLACYYPHHRWSALVGTPPLRVLPSGGSPMISAMEDAWRESKEEQLAMAMAENMRDMAQVMAARLRAELRGTGRYPFPSLPSIDC